MVRLGQIVPLSELLYRKPVQGHRVRYVIKPTIVYVIIDSDWLDRGRVLVVLLLAPQLLCRHVTPQEHILIEVTLFTQEVFLLFRVQTVEEVGIRVIHLDFLSSLLV